ncbi:MAG TPA: hypothetical protein VNC18_15590 [Gemmatimonadaceae bacterium]|jgi:hypothetical protein|nr:hypothetical protein [Gemmatimonadaceae bacterium]
MRSHPVRTRVALLFLLATAACVRHSQTGPEVDARPEPIPVHVKNENFLDMNIAVVVSGVSRRLGNVVGNGSGDFMIDGNLAIGQTLYLTATPIGGRGQATSGGLSVGPGQMIDFTVASTLRQSVATVHDAR